MNHEDNLKIHGDENFDGPVPDRRWTDVLYLIIFIVANAAFIGTAVFVVFEGDPNRLTKGYDFRAEICGVDGLKDWRFMYWPDVNNLDMSLWIEACPYHYVEDYYCMYEEDHETMLRDWPCWDTYLTKAYGFYCLPADKEARDDVLEYLDAPMMFLKRSAGDLILAWDCILAGVLISISIGMIYMLWFRLANIMSWIVKLSMIACVWLLFFLGYLVYRAAERIHDQVCDDYGPVEMVDCEETTASFVYRCIAAFFGCLAIILTVVIFLKRKQIKVAIGIIKITAKPLGVMVQMFLFPLIFLIIGLGIMSAFTASVVWTMSIGKIEEFEDGDIPGGEAKKLVFTEEEKYVLAFNMLMFLWWMTFLITLAEFLFSFAVSIWYFCREKSNIYRPLWRAIKICFRYHIGSVVLASLLFFVFSFPRRMYSPIIRRLKRAKQNCCIRAISDCCCWCLEMHEALFKYLAPPAITYLALFGDKFITSARRGYFLMERNRYRVDVSTRAGGFIVSIMKLTIALSGTTFCYAWILYKDETFSEQLTIELVTATGPAIFCFIICMFIGYTFGGVFSACLNTVAGCASADEEMFTNEQRFMEEELQDFLDLVDEARRDEKVLKARGGKVNPKGYVDDAQYTEMEYASDKAALKPGHFPQHDIKIGKGNTDGSYAAGILSTARALGQTSDRYEESKFNYDNAEDLFSDPHERSVATTAPTVRSSRPLLAPSGISGLSAIRGDGSMQMYRANNFYSPSVMTSQIAFQVPESDFDLIDDERPVFR